MHTVIFRSSAPALTGLMLLFSVFILLRGHNEPGGGFIGGLLGAAALALHALAFGADAARRALAVHPMDICAAGLTLAILSGLPAFFVAEPFMTSQWLVFDLGDSEIALSTPLFFDIGVYLVVFGAFIAIALSLQEAAPPLPGEEADGEDR